jgi:hypothetical protein
MAVKLSPIFNEQEFDANGNPLVGGKLYTFAAGSSTPLASYTSITGLTAQANPIILNSRGEVDNPIWITTGLSYKFALYNVNDVLVRTVDNVTGVNDSSVSIDQWVDSGVVPTYVSATQFTLPGDQTSSFTVNRRIKATVTAGTVYGYISISAFAALTTITVVLDSGALDTGLSTVQLGLLTPTNSALPQVSTSQIQDSAITTAKLANAYINDLTEVTFDLSADFVAIADASDSGNKKKAKIPSIQKISDLDASVAANALTITINAGVWDFRSTTLTDGTPVTRTLSSPVSIVVPSGATLGTTNGNRARLAILAINNAGIIETAIINLSGGNNLDESGLISTTAVSAAANANNVAYSTTARSNVAYRVVGYIEITEATAGTWATAPTLVQGSGGQALQRVNSICNGVSVASTSGTSIDFTGIPSWAKRITVIFNEVSTNGTADLLVQLGDSGGIENTGYISTYIVLSTGGSSTAGFIIRTGAAAVVASGILQINLIDTTSWICTHTIKISTTNASAGAGSKSLSGILDRVRVTTTNGTDAFDAGSINILYE